MYLLGVHRFLRSMENSMGGNFYLWIPAPTSGEGKLSRE
jgi:hypothetical protein